MKKERCHFCGKKKESIRKFKAVICWSGLQANPVTETVMACKKCRQEKASYYLEKQYRLTRPLPAATIRRVKKARPKNSNSESGEANGRGRSRSR